MGRGLVERARRGDRDAFATLVHGVSDGALAVNNSGTDLTEPPQGFVHISHWVETP